MGISVWEVTSPVRLQAPLSRLSEFHGNVHGTGAKDEKCVNGTQIFH